MKIWQTKYYSNIQSIFNSLVELLRYFHRSNKVLLEGPVCIHQGIKYGFFY
jgi:hypothetical protein